MAKDLLEVEIGSPDKQIWQGQAQSVSSINSMGPFDILPMHANFITIIENKTIKVKSMEKLEEFLFPNAIIYSSKNKVYIYTL